MKNACLLMSIWFIVSNAPLQAQICPQQPELIAKEFLQEEFWGRREQHHSSCLKKANFEWITPSHDPPSEAVKKSYVRPESLVIQNIEKKNGDIEVYRVTFNVLASQDAGKTWSVHQDHLEYMKNQDKQKNCALLLESPSIRLLEKRCEN